MLVKFILFAIFVYSGIICINDVIFIWRLNLV